MEGTTKTIIVLVILVVLLFLWVKKLLLKNQKLQSTIGKVNQKNGTFLEALSPLVMDFGEGRKQLHHMGQPVDFICFDYDNRKLRIIEVKTGDAVLTQNQKEVKRWINEGRVEFETVKI